MNPGGNRLNGVLPETIGDLKSLKKLYLTDNFELGDVLLDTLFTLPVLKEIYIDNCSFKGDVSPKMISLDSLTSVIMDSNYFTFENLLQVNSFLSSNPNHDFTPQNLIYVDTTITKVEGENLTIDLNIDNSLSNSTYTWTKDNIPYQTLNSNTLTFTGLQVSDSGIYKVSVTNPDVPSLTLESHEIQIVVRSSACDPIADSTELVRIYNEFDGPNWINGQNNNWRAGRFNTWEGVITNTDGCVDILVLDAGGLTGDLIDIQLPELKVLNLYGNQLTGFIPNFAGMPILEELFLGGNNLTGDVPDFSGVPALTKLHFQENSIAGNIPDFSGLSMVSELTFMFNDLPNLPRFSNFINSQQPIGLIQMQGNALTFEDLLPLNELNFTGSVGNFQYTPQDSVYKDTTIVVQQGDDLTIDLGFDASIVDNVYTWTKDGSLHTTRSDNQLPFTNLQIGNAGDYTFTITNPQMPNLTLQGRTITIQVNAPNNCRDRDSLALIALYNSTDGANWMNVWDLAQPMDTWFGVTLNTDGCVECLDLDGEASCSAVNAGGNNLIGTIPPELGNLSNLTWLSLFNNQLSGNIPIELGNLSELTILDFALNELSGTIPTEFGNLTNLTGLWLYDNQLSGNLPIELGNLTNLTGLSLSRNQLSGTLPIEIGNLVNLDGLYLSGNQFSGMLPSEIGNLSNLIWLELANNQLSGSIPAEIRNLTNLMGIYLQNNRLTDCFPNEINIHCPLGFASSIGQPGYNFTNNPELPWQGDFERFCNGEQQEGATCDDGDPNTQNDVIQADCSCQGVIVNTCRQTDSLALIALYNSTDGANWTNTWDLNTSINTWFGVTLNGDGCVLRLNFFNNNLVGTIPPELGTLTNLEWLDLSQNLLNSLIPQELGSLTNLTYLWLNRNELTGSIPEELGNLTNLTSLNLWANQLNGNIPKEFGDLINLTSLVLGFNQLSGNIPSELGNLTNLGRLNLQDNELSGCFVNQLSIHCSLGFGIVTGPGYNFTNNPQLPWSGDFERFCNGEQQEGATCDDGDPNTQNDVIQADCSCQGTIINPCRQQDSLALIALYNSTDGANWTNTWDLSQPIDTWYGVTLNVDGCVECLDLDGNPSCNSNGSRGNNLTGVIPIELGNLLNLTALFFRQNKLRGSIPSELGNLSNLTSLGLRDNDLTGGIPIELGNLSNLTWLELNGNDLSGSIPDELGNLSRLNELSLNNNQLSGRIPSEFGNLLNLKRLYLNDNALIGSICRFQLKSAPDSNRKVHRLARV